MTVRQRLNEWTRTRGFTISRHGVVPPDIDDEARRLIAKVGDYTMQSPERLFALIEAVRYIQRAQIDGAIVECGVWRGGSMMLAAMQLISAGRTDRDLFLYDTFEGMPAPSQIDRDRDGVPAAERLSDDAARKDTSHVWAYAGRRDVEINMESTGYPPARVSFVQGKVEDTLPAMRPERISLLRLDTDWYESTRHELEVLVPCLTPGGVLIIDDYGHWEGARRAVDEWLVTRPDILMHRIDDTGRACIVP